MQNPVQGVLEFAETSRRGAGSAIGEPERSFPVVSKNTDEIKIGSPGRFGIEVSTLGWPMEARILGHEDADPAVPSICSSARIELD